MIYFIGLDVILKELNLILILVFIFSFVIFGGYFHQQWLFDICNDPQ